MVGYQVEAEREGYRQGQGAYTHREREYEKKETRMSEE
jgi:hypothetical protein